MCTGLLVLRSDRRLDAGRRFMSAAHEKPQLVKGPLSDPVVHVPLKR